MQQGVSINTGNFFDLFKKQGERILNSLPNEINVIKKHGIVFGDITKLVVIIFIIVNSLLFAGGIWYYFDTNELRKEIKANSYTFEESEYLRSYFMVMSRWHPNDSKDLIKQMDEKGLPIPIKIKKQYDKLKKK